MRVIYSTNLQPDSCVVGLSQTHNDIRYFKVYISLFLNVNTANHNEINNCYQNNAEKCKVDSEVNL